MSIGENIIGENIKNLRLKYGLEQSQIATIAGVTNKAVSSWELGNSIPRMGAIEKLATHFNIKKSEIIDKNPIQDINDISFNTQIIPYASLNPKIYKIEKILENGAISDDDLKLIEFILDKYQKQS